MMRAGSEIPPGWAKVPEDMVVGGLQSLSLYPKGCKFPSSSKSPTVLSARSLALLQDSWLVLLLMMLPSTHKLWSGTTVIILSVIRLCPHSVFQFDFGQTLSTMLS